MPPMLTAWLEAQQAFNRLAAAAFATNPASSAAQQSFADPYRLLFTMPAVLTAGADAATSVASMRRYQQASARIGRLLNAAAAEAGRRLGAALATDAPGAVPITTLRELQTLWIDCGEAAWSAAAHREEFALAQAELLAAWVALRVAGQAG
jgi:hypothetical protein